MAGLSQTYYKVIESCFICLRIILSILWKLKKVSYYKIIIFTRTPGFICFSNVVAVPCGLTPIPQVQPPGLEIKRRYNSSSCSISYFLYKIMFNRKLTLPSATSPDKAKKKVSPIAKTKRRIMICWLQKVLTKNDCHKWTMIALVFLYNFVSHQKWAGKKFELHLHF